MMRRLMAPLALFALCIGLLAGTGSAVTAQTTYTCPDMSCSFMVPGSYTETQNNATSVTFSDSNTGGTFVVAVTDIPSGTSVQDAATTVLTQVSTLNSFAPDPAGVQSETVGGNPAASLVYTYVADDGSNAKAKIFFTVYNAKLYILQFATTASQEDAFVQGAQPVFNSWMFI